MADREELIKKGSFLLDIAKFILPSVIAIFVAYGTIQFTKGTDGQRLTNIESEIDKLHRGLQFNNERLVSRYELELYMKAQTDLLNAIREDIRSLKNRK